MGADLPLAHEAPEIAIELAGLPMVAVPNSELRDIHLFSLHFRHIIHNQMRFSYVSFATTTKQRV